MFGYVPKGRTKKVLKAYAAPPTRSEWEQLFFIAPIFSDIVYSPVFEELFKKLLESVMFSIGKVREMTRDDRGFLEERYSKLEDHILEMDRLSRLADIHRRENLLSRYGDLVRSTGHRVEQFTAPIDSSCDEIAQFANSDDEHLFDGTYADVVRGREYKLDNDLMTYRILRIHKVNVSTGHCRFVLENVGKISGWIRDPIIRMPDNPYTAAMNSHKELLVTAKAARRGEAVRELYISGALIDVGDKAGRVDHEK